MRATRLLNAIGASGTPSRSQAFRLYHAIVPAVLFAALLLLSMAAFHPVLCAISLCGALAFGLICRGAKAVGKSLMWALPLFALVALLNPLFSALGTTQLGTFLGYPLYQESLAYGICMGLLMCSVVVWMQNAATVITMEDTMSLVGNVAPVIGLMMSMIARLIPRYLTRGNYLASIQSANTSATPATSADALHRGRRRFGTLLSWSMEDSLITADAMAARGWQAQRTRSSYQRRTMRSSDIGALCVIALIVACAVWGAWHVAQGFNFYPRMDAIQLHPGMVAYALCMFLPCIFEGVERLLWRR